MGNVITKHQVELALLEVRDFILSDGGDIHVVDIDHQLDQKIIVSIKLEGACISCPLSAYTVQFGILKALQEKISSNIQVILVD
jgi:Fe-S cluster biogenesis protein NfuA